jgi:hypothetical protein
MVLNRVTTAQSEYWIAQERDRYLAGRKDSEKALFEIPQPMEAAPGFAERIFTAMRLQRHVDIHHRPVQMHEHLRQWSARIDCHQAARLLLDPKVPIVDKARYTPGLSALWVDSQGDGLVADADRRIAPGAEPTINPPFLLQIGDLKIFRSQGRIRAAHTAWVVGFDPETSQWVVAEKEGWDYPFRMVTLNTARIDYPEDPVMWGTPNEFQRYLHGMYPELGTQGV